VTRALTEGQLDRDVPWLYQASVRVLKTATPPRDQAVVHFRQALEAQYGADHAGQKPPAPGLDGAARTLAALYHRNIYPDMKLTWGTYTSQIGHGGPDPGAFKGQCFRCHAGDHQTSDGQVLSNKCEVCHEVVAKDELPKDLPEDLLPLLRF
jgi:hypothetical protein